MPHHNACQGCGKKRKNKKTAHNKTHKQAVKHQNNTLLNKTKVTKLNQNKSAAEKLLDIEN